MNSEFIWKNERKRERSVSILGFKSLSMRLEDSWTQHRIYDEVGTAVASGRKLLLFSEQLSIWKMLSSPTNPSSKKGQWFPAGGDSRSIEKLNTNRSRCRLEVSAHRCRRCTPACPQEVHIQPYTNSMMPSVAARCISIFCLCLISISIFSFGSFLPSTRSSWWLQQCWRLLDTLKVVCLLLVCCRAESKT